MLAVLTLLCSWNIGLADESAVQELQITAAYLYHFPKFIEWPSAIPVFHYCIYQDADFTELLGTSYNDSATTSDRIEVKNIDAHSKLKDCRLIYFSQPAPAGFLERIAKLSILSVGTQKNFSDLGGIIYLFKEDQKMHFYINNAAATAAGLKIGSQLLRLSREKP